MRWIAFGVVLPVIVASAVCADEVASPTLVVRSGPGGQYRQVGVLTQGTQVQATGQASRGYLPVSFTGGRGWVPEQFIRRAGQSQPGPLGTFTPIAAPIQTGTPGMAGGTPGVTPAPAQSAPAPMPAQVVPPAPVTAQVVPPAPMPAQVVTPAPMPAQVATPAAPTAGFTPTPAGGPSNSGNGGGSNPLGNVLGSVLPVVLGNVLGGGSNSSSPLSGILGSALGGSSGGSSSLPSLLGNVLGGGSSNSSPIPGLVANALGGGSNSSALNSSPLTATLGSLAQGGGSGSSPLQSLLGGGSSNPLGALLGSSSGGPSILNSSNTSPILGGGTPSTSTPGVPAPGASGGFSNPGAVGTSASVTATQLNVRSGPGTQYRIIGALFRGAQVQVTSNSGSWFEVLQSTGAKGWVHGAYLSGGGSQLAPASTIPGGPASVNTGVSAALPGSSGGGVPAGAGNERRSSAGYIQLSASGTGYYTYYSASRKWGRPNVIYGIMRVGQRLAQGGLPQLGVGDISAENGGAISGHASHQRGVDVDCRLMYSDRVNRAGTIDHPSYSSAWTATAIRLFRAEISTNLVLFNDRSIIAAGLSQNYPNHANHFHFRAN